MKKVKIYKRFERFWHWAQAILIIGLGITGFEIKGSFHLLGFERAHQWHQQYAWLLIALIIFAIFWHLTTGEWRQYVPTPGKRKMIRYYLYGIFLNEPHPEKKTELSKLNPLQRMTYLGFKLVIIPVQVMSGLLYLYNQKWTEWGLDWLSLRTIATIHVLGSFALVLFLIVHVYMTSTGHTVTSNLKAMVTGYEELEE